MIYPPKPRPGDRVAVLSPSNGNPSRFPHVYELGLSRLKDEIGLAPVEFPTTRVSSTPAERAADFHAALLDPTITSIMATIGGNDQLTVLRHLDVDLVRAHPKPFFGYSDNTNLLNFLFHAGVVGYHGGSVMVHLGRGGAAEPASMASLKAALFTSGWYELASAPRWTDQANDWNDPANLLIEPPTFPSEGWVWHNGDRVIEGRAWGGCIEIIAWALQVGTHILLPEAYAGHVLFIESSEEMPAADEVYYTLRSMGERGMLEQFEAVIVGRPKAWEFSRPNTPVQKRAYADAQREAILRATGAYAPRATVVFDLDLGHTDPNLIIPYGGDIRIDGINRTIAVRY